MLGRERIVTAAYSCLLEQKWHTFPIEPALFHFSWPIISYQEYARLCGVAPSTFLEEGYEGFSVTGLRGRTLILYNDQSPLCRQRFTVAHELGHLLLHHQGHLRRHEEEADFFASLLLLPDAVLNLLHSRGFSLTEAFLMQTFGVSRNTARHKRTAFTKPPIYHPLDRQIEALFFPEICRFPPAAQSNFNELEEQYLGYNR